MSKLSEQLNARGFHNPHNFYEGVPFGQPFIAYYPATTGRAGQSARWKVFRQGESLSEAWYDHGAKTFLKWGDKQKAFEDAKTWASEKFGIKEWARDPFGSWGEAEFVRKRITEILALPEYPNSGGYMKRTLYSELSRAIQRLRPQISPRAVQNCTKTWQN